MESLAFGVQVKMQQSKEDFMGKLLDKIKNKLQSKDKKEIGERNVKSTKTFPRQKAPLK